MAHEFETDKLDPEYRRIKCPICGTFIMSVKVGSAGHARSNCKKCKRIVDVSLELKEKPETVEG